jgi:hypothetical protein
MGQRVTSSSPSYPSRGGFPTPDEQPRAQVMEIHAQREHRVERLRRHYVERVGRREADLLHAGELA